jgi:prepilin-type N-terminal cleavage/methylation domain-containing protein/prepilin-type processing-associated H-X9-DG protein
MHINRKRRLPDRPGFSLIELMVVMAILGLMMALLLPAVQRVRETARRTQCLNQMRQLGMALVDFEGRQQRFPALGYWSASGPEVYHSWVVEILPGLDQSALHAQWNFDEPNDDSANSKNGVLSHTPLPILVCPSDVTAISGQGNQSYVVNAGVGWTKPSDCPFTLETLSGGGTARVNFDLNGDGIACPGTLGQDADKQVFKALGIFFAENWPIGSGTVRHHSLKSITDGTTTTLLLSENVRAGFDPAFNTTWATPDAVRQSFILSGYICESFSCSAGAVDYSRANNRSTLPYLQQAINSSLNQPEGAAPWPSSHHSGGVNVTFCDGHAQFLSEHVDGEVYAAIMSPQGTTVGGPLKQRLVTGSEF